MLTPEELNERVRTLKSLIRHVEELESDINNIKDELKEEMESSGIYELKGPDWKITWNLVASKRFIQSRFKEENPDLYAKYLGLSESRRFLID